MHNNHIDISGESDDKWRHRNKILQLETSLIHCYSHLFQILGRYKVIDINFYFVYSFWNVDYVEAIGLYPLKSINRMES